MSVIFSVNGRDGGAFPSQSQTNRTVFLPEEGLASLTKKDRKRLVELAKKMVVKSANCSVANLDVERFNILRSSFHAELDRISIEEIKQAEQEELRELREFKRSMENVKDTLGLM